MNEPRERDHLGLWKIEPPKDMPLVQIAMLQETIKEAWATYGGDPNNGEQFWNHLVGNGAANVPRETSPHQKVVDFLAESDRVIAEQGLDVPRETSPEVWDAHAEYIRQRAAASEYVHVPRETSGGDDASS